MSRRVLLCALLLVCSLPVASMAQTADNGFEITTDSSIETPERMVTVDGDEYQVTSIARMDPDGSLTLSVTAPSDTSYNLLLYDNDRQIVATNSETGETSWTLSGSDYSSGSYVVAIYADGEYKAVQPIVVSGYEVTISAPETITEGADLKPTIEVSSLGDPDDISSVEVILMNDDTSRRLDATESDEETYTASLPTSVSPGDYRIYATVQGNEGYQGQAELLGISDRHAITIEEESTTEEPAGGGDGGDEGGSDNNGDDSDSDSDSADEEADVTSTATESTTTQSTSVTTETTTDQSTSTTTSQETTDGVVTPRGSTTATPTTSSGAIPLEAPQILLLCTLVGMLALRLKKSK